MQGQDLTALVAAITAANQASTAIGTVATPEQKVDDTKHMPPPPDGENYTSDKDCIEVMLNQNVQCPECGGGGARYTLCQDCEDSGMIYGILPDRNSNRNDESESEDPSGHCQECNGIGTIGVLCQDCEDTGMIYKSSAATSTVCTW